MFGVILLFLACVIGIIIGYVSGTKDTKHQAVRHDYGYYDEVTRQFHWGKSPKDERIESLTSSHSARCKEYETQVTNLIDEIEEIETTHEALVREHRRCGKRKR